MSPDFHNMTNNINNCTCLFGSENGKAINTTVFIIDFKLAIGSGKVKCPATIGIQNNICVASDKGSIYARLDKRHVTVQHSSAMEVHVNFTGHTRGRFWFHFKCKSKLLI